MSGGTEQVAEQEWLSKYDVYTGRLKEDLSNATYTWAQQHNERMQELVEQRIKEDMTKCYYDIIDFIGEWVDTSDEVKKMCAIWVIGTYFHKQFNSFPYLLINATKGSGKTRLLSIISWLQYKGNGELLNNPSESVIFRTAKDRGLILDEFESERSKDKQSLREYLNSCYKIGGMVYRIEKQKNKEGKEEMVSVGHSIYTPIAMANINGIDDVLADRAIQVILERSNNNYITLMLEDFPTNQKLKDLKFALTRSCELLCRVCSVHPSKKVHLWNQFICSRYTHYTLHTSFTHSTHSTLQLDSKTEELFVKITETGINGRNLELFFPLILTAFNFNNEVAFDLINLFSKLNEKKKNEDFIESRDVSLLDFVRSCDKYRFSEVHVSQLYTEYKVFINWRGEEDEKWLTLQWFGMALKRMNLIRSKRRSNQGYMVTLDIDKAKEKIKLFKKEEEVKDETKA